MYLKLLQRHVKQGTLTLNLPDGTQHSFGEGEPHACWNIHDETAIRRIAADWEYELGETYMRGGWDAGSEGLVNLLALLRLNFKVVQPSRWLAWFYKLVRESNRIKRSYQNISHHYDVPETVFRRFLDREMFYSCAYFHSDTMSLEQAQQAKARHIANKLLIKPGNRILDIGCGWGSMAFYLAQEFEVEVVGITLSREQLAAACREQQIRGINNVRFELADYREHKDSYDRIVSVGMFEHVGRPYYRSYFEKINEMLKPEGVALVHTIGRNGVPALSNPWISKYIFPGGYNPSPSELIGGIEQSSLLLTDLEVWRLHYAHTLEHWLSRFQHHRDAIRDEMNEEFCRMWEFYLASCAIAFRHSNLVVYQAQLAHGHGAVPVTRNYLYAEK